MSGAPAPPPDTARLRDAMAAVARDRTDDTMRDLFAALAESSVVVPVRPAGEGRMQLAVADREDGVLFFAFTSPEALERFAQGPAQWTGMPVTGLARLVLTEARGRLLIDAGAEDGGELSRRDLELLGDGLVPGTADRTTGVSATATGEIRLFAPEAEVDEGLLAVAREAAGGLPGLRAVHLLEASLGGGPRRAVLGVELGTAPRSALTELAGAVRRAVPAGEHLDLLGLDDDQAEVAAAIGRRVWAA